jgi:hypothetical protein
MRIRALLFFIFAVVILFSPPNALACACCADAGTYVISTKKPTNFEFGELAKIKFATANLFTTPAYPEDLKGINSEGENFSLGGSLQGNLWKLNFKEEQNKSGTLNLTKPISMVAFMADLHDSKDNGLTINLYKEWRFKYRVQSGTGIFQTGIAPATEYFLVLQGRGNACTQAEDFTHWRLEITGKRASYAFFGTLSTGKTASK